MCVGPFSQDDTERPTVRVPGPHAAHVTLSESKQKQNEVPLKYICCLIYGSFEALPPLSLVVAKAPLWSMIPNGKHQPDSDGLEAAGAAGGRGALLHTTAEALRPKPFPHYLLLHRHKRWVMGACLMLKR